MCLACLYLFPFCPCILKINILEMEKSSSQQNLDTVFDLATEQNKSAREKFEEVVIVLVNNVFLPCLLI